MVLEDFLGDVRISLRALLKVPILTLTIVATVGLGIGATTVIFSAVNAALLRPLPYAEPDRLVRIYTDAPPNRFQFSVADYLALDAQQTRFEKIAGYANREMTFTDGSVAERVAGRAVSSTYFSLLGIRPVLGRDFLPADGKPGAPPTVIVTHAFWQQRMGGAVDAIGKTIQLDGVGHTVVGVLPEKVGPLEQRQEYFVAAQWEPPRRKGPFFITALGRLRADTTPAAAADELRAINRRIFPLWQASYQDANATWGLIDLKTHVVGDVRAVAGLALGAVALVWLIACANASNLLVARVTSRRRELAVRATLGASRGRVMRHLLIESAILSLGAAVVGVALAWAGVELLHDVGPGYFPRTQEISFDGAVLWLLGALTATSVLLFGLVPAVHGTGGSMEESLRSTGRSSTGNLAARRLRRVLVASQFAIATPLLVVAGLLLGTLNQLGRVDLGFDSRNVLTGVILLPQSQYRDPGNVATFWDELQRRAEALPGVSSVAFSDGRPPNDVNNHNNFDLEDAPTPPGGNQPVTPWVAVTPEYFKVIGLSLLQGRLFDERDGLTNNIDVVIVDRAWAQRFFPNQSAVGKRLKQGGCSTCPWTTVVGVVSTVRYDGLDRPNQGTVYWPMSARGTRPSEQATTRTRYLVLRASTAAGTVLPSVRQVIRELDPSLPFARVALIDDLVERSLQRPRSLSRLVGGVAIVALVLSLIGIYGVMANYVKQHSKDISIRLALGGSRGDVLRLVVGQGMMVVAAGVGVGLLTALAATRLMSTLLFGVSAADAFTFTAVSGLLLFVSLVACLVPARHAASLHPAAVLREE